MIRAQRSLTVRCPAGMSNRLRVLISGKALAEASGRTFAMQWTPQAACGCAFDQLFVNDWNVGADIFFDERHTLDLTHRSWQFFPNLLDESEPSLYVQSYSWLVQPTLWSEHLEPHTRAAELLRELEPIPDVARRIREFRERFFRPTMIGVHLRRGDHTVTRPDVVANLDAAMDQVDTWLGEKADAGILLCTDDGAVDPYSGRAMPNEDIAGQFVRRYGARVVFTTPSSLDRRTPQAIQDGLVDLWLLRATDFFVGTRASSFSELAVFGRNIPFTQTAAGTPQYQRRVRWMKWFGVYDALVRKGYTEFGRDAPYTSLVRRYMIRLRVLLTGKI